MFDNLCFLEFVGVGGGGGGGGGGGFLGDESSGKGRKGLSAESILPSSAFHYL